MIDDGLPELEVRGGREGGEGGEGGGGPRGRGRRRSERRGWCSFFFFSVVGVRGGRRPGCR